MNTYKKQSLLAALAISTAVAAGCATQPTPHLVDARRAYEQAHSGYANEQVPDEVYEAKVALDAAERAHDRKPGSEDEKHLSYVAHRKALQALAAADSRVALTHMEKADAKREQVLLTQRDASREKLEDTEENLDETQKELSEEQKARTEAQRTADAALKSLEEIASIKAEEERVVITLSGEVLFKFNEATLLPIAQARLDKVAEVLKDTGADKPIVIAGHTDSRGSSNYNTELSRKRAESVRTYLVGKGVPQDMVQAVGKGENEPIADNKTAEGRANNRRVEIIIDESAGKTHASRQ